MPRTAWGSLSATKPTRAVKPPLYIRHGKAGLTLLEISIVILTLFTLIAVLFVGAQAYKKGSDRSSCILNIRNVQQALRHFQNTNLLNIGDSVSASSIYQNNNSAYLRPPSCPGGGTYTLSSTIPDYSTPALTCSLSGNPAQHAPQNTDGW